MAPRASRIRFAQDIGIPDRGTLPGGGPMQFLIAKEEPIADAVGLIIEVQLDRREGLHIVVVIHGARRL